MWKQAAFYGVLLAVGTLVLQWLDYQRRARVFRRNLCVPDCRRFSGAPCVHWRTRLRMPMTFVEIFPVGVLVSLVTAGLLRNSRFLPARRA